MEYKDIKCLSGQHGNYIMEMKQKVKAAGSKFDYLKQVIDEEVNDYN
jgi:hypothetical protein